MKSFFICCFTLCGQLLTINYIKTVTIGISENCIYKNKTQSDPLSLDQSKKL